jgi:hypothetical protein
MSSPDPVPSYFGLRYVAWFIWSNAITGLMIIQVAVTAITLDPTIVSHNTFHYALIANAVLAAIVAQLKKNTPPSPPPTKGP